MSLLARSVDRRLLRSQLFIEENLANSLALAPLARRAGMSRFHFLRCFSRLAGEPVGRHIQRLRLERAAFDLLYSRARVIDIALDAGFESPEAFARAFGRWCGLSPRRFRTARPILNEPAPVAPEWRKEFARYRAEFCVEPAQLIRFVRRQGVMSAAVSGAWEKMNRLLDGRISPDARQLVTFTPDFPRITPPDKLRFDVGIVAKHSPALPSDELMERPLPGGRYAVFRIELSHEARHVLDLFWRYLYLIWAPTTGVQIRPWGAYHLSRPLGRLGALRVEVHVPVR
ncbi:MAG TPA: helix-turn-helix domain-containing protein [Opitutaceae bacterium]